MAEDEFGPEDDRDRPVLTGLLALVGVAVVVGVVLGGGALAATRVLGIGEDGSASDGSSSQESLYIPPPEPTDPETGPLLTLSTPSSEATQESSPEARETQEAEPITLNAGQTTVSPMEQIDLTGVYPSGEGAILQVQRREGGRWEDFPVTVAVANQTFSTYIQTGHTGRNRFRVVDTDSGVTSNEVVVTIG